MLRADSVDYVGRVASVILSQRVTSNSKLNNQFHTSQFNPNTLHPEAK